MNRNRLVMIGLIALALGFFVSFSVYSKMKGQGRPVAQAGAEALVAARNIEVGSKLGPDDLKVAHFVPESLPGNYFRQPSEVLGRGIVLPIARGEFILPGKLAEEGAGSGLPAKIPRGMRAVSVRVNDIVSIAGYVQPGTHVDVLVTGTPTGASEPQTKTVLENVAVLATGQKLTPNAAGDAPDQASVITLAVSPDDAQKLALASTDGRIQLALRNPLDDKREGLGSVTTSELYRGAAPPPTPNVPRVRPRSSSVQAPPAPAVFTVEMIKGDKKEQQKF